MQIWIIARKYATILKTGSDSLTGASSRRFSAADVGNRAGERQGRTRLPGAWRGSLFYSDLIDRNICRNCVVVIPLVLDRCLPVYCRASGNRSDQAGIHKSRSTDRLDFHLRCGSAAAWLYGCRGCVGSDAARLVDLEVGIFVVGGHARESSRSWHRVCNGRVRRRISDPLLDS